MTALECINWVNFQRDGPDEVMLSLLANPSESFKHGEPLRVVTLDENYAALCARTAYQYHFAVTVTPGKRTHVVTVFPDNSYVKPN